MAHISIYEFDFLTHDAEESATTGDDAKLHEVPPTVFAWLQAQALHLAEANTPVWLQLSQRRGRPAVRVKSFVGVIRAPDSFQIEVLPKIGKTTGSDGNVKARQLLIDMLRCLAGFRHVQTDSAQLAATCMPLLEVFISEFLRSTAHLVKRGLRSDYSSRQDNLLTLRGKLQMAAHLRHNHCRCERFFVAFDKFSPDRPENRLLHAALRRALAWTASQANQQLARELCFVFAQIPASRHPLTDFQRIRLDRGMSHYEDALAWARLILSDESPLTGLGHHQAPSLLFPMEAVFEAFVAKHLARQLRPGHTLHVQTHSLAMVRHREQDWFHLKPDLLVRDATGHRLVLDTKWKLLAETRATGTDKYGLDQADFYQLYTYGQNYLNGHGDVVLIYPKTEAFTQPCPVFEFPKSEGLRLWVLPFCLQEKRLLLLDGSCLQTSFSS